MGAIKINKVYICKFKGHKSLFRVDSIEEKQVHTTDLKYNLKSTLPVSLIEYCMKQGNIAEYVKDKKRVGSAAEDQGLNEDEMWKRDNFYNFILGIEKLSKKYGIVVSSKNEELEPFYCIQHKPGELTKLEYIGSWATGKASVKLNR